MKRIAAFTALAAFALAPVLAWANCGGDHDDSSASATPPSKVATTASAPASKARAATAKAAAPAATPVKQAVVKPKAAAPERKMVAASGN